MTKHRFSGRGLRGIAWAAAVASAVAGSGPAMARTERLACDPAQAAVVRDGLQAYLEGRLPASALRIVYSDLHGLHGGVRIAIDGSGRITQEAQRVPVGQPRRQVPRAEVEGLVRLLIEVAAWEQRVTPAGPVVPDSSSAELATMTGERGCRIWERFNDLAANDRIGRVRDRMLRLAWTRPE